jgi:hypothetical protein
VTSDGCVRVLLSNLAIGQAALDSASLGAAAVLSPPRALAIKSLMCHGIVPAWVSLTAGQPIPAHDEERAAAAAAAAAELATVGGEWPLLDSSLAARLRASDSTAERCLLTARYFGNEPGALAPPL